MILDEFGALVTAVGAVPLFICFFLRAKTLHPTHTRFDYMVLTASGAILSGWILILSWQAVLAYIVDGTPLRIDAIYTIAELFSGLYVSTTWRTWSHGKQPAQSFRSNYPNGHPT